MYNTSNNIYIIKKSFKMLPSKLIEVRAIDIVEQNSHESGLSIGQWT